MQWVNFSEYASMHRSSKSSDRINWFSGGMYEFIKILPVTTWAYGGVETLSLAASATSNPKVNLPIGMITSVLTLFATNMLIIFIATSLPQGISKLQESDFPLNYGYNRIFNCGDSVSSILVIPGQFAMAFGFVLPFGKLVQSLTNSNLFPTFLDVKGNELHNRYYAIMIATFISFLFCLLGLISSEISNSLNNIAILAEFLTNTCTLVGYVLLKIKFSGINRKFESPFGICGAIFSFIIFLLGIVSLVGDFQNDGGVSAIIVFGICALLSFYYFLYAKKIQTFLTDEQQSLFKFHVINLNKEKKRLMKTKNAQKRLSFSLSFISPFNISDLSSSFKSFLSSIKRKNTRQVHVIASNGSLESIVEEEPLNEILPASESQNNFLSNQDSDQNLLENSACSLQDDQPREWRRKSSDVSAKNDYLSYHKDFVSNSIPPYVHIINTSVEVSKQDSFNIVDTS
jgi:hypothetical protein